MTRQNIRKSIAEIYNIYQKKSYDNNFSIQSITLLFEIGNEIFLQDNPTEIENLINQPPSDAPDIMDDEPYSLKRTLTIYNKLKPEYPEVNPILIGRVFELNSRLAWVDYKEKYKAYIFNICDEHPRDEYLNYLAAVLYYEKKEYSQSLKRINLALAQNNTCSLYAHIKALNYIQTGAFDSARTFLYQSLFLIELMQDVAPKLKGRPEIYPNYPIEYHTSVDMIRSDLAKLDAMEAFFENSVTPLINGQVV